jgi:branched-chain amino acid transport system substrate-binding protein
MKTKIFILILAGAAILFINSSYSLAAEPGITKDSIKIGWFCPLSGPFQSYGVDPWRAAKMWYDKVNKEGGIHGRKLEVVAEDDKCMGTDLVAAVKKLVTKEEVFILHGGCCSSAIVSAEEYIERVKVPLVMVLASGDQSLYPPRKYIFGGFSITQHGEGGSMIDFVTKYLKAKRIAWIIHNDAYGSWSLEGAEYQLKKLYPGMTLATVERVERDMTDATAVALKVKNANPDVVCILTYDRPSVLIIKALYDIGVKCAIVLGSNGNSNMVNTVKAVGVKEAFANFYCEDMTAHEPGGRIGRDWARKMYGEYYPEMAKLPEFPTSYMFSGLASTMVVTKALQDAGPNPTREKFIKALENMGEYDPRGLVACPYELSPDNHAALVCELHFKIEVINPLEGTYKEIPIPGVFKSLWKYEEKK